MIVHHYALKYGIPYVIQSHGALPKIMSKQKLKSFYDMAWGRALLRDASMVIAVSALEVEQYKEAGVGESKISVIPNGIDCAEFADLPPEGTLRKKLGLSSETKVVLYLGRINEIKGLDLLAMAFKGLIRGMPEARLIIAGFDDGYGPRLKKLVQDLGLEGKVLSPGPCYGRDKLAAYVDADVYVLSSNYEIFGITVLEALACGTPVVVTDRCGLAGTVAERAGLVVPYEIEPLRIALARMLNDDDLRRQCSATGKTLVCEQFDWKNIVNQVEQLYREVQPGKLSIS
jgi:glycosyltransferase involved in cell wall biosynthesis